MLAPAFAEDRAALDALLERLPLLPCAHCGRCGNLIGHGLLRGYAEHGNERLTRGRRFFCSNRGRKRGCGRTVSTLLTRFIKRCIVTAATLWTLFGGLAGGLSTERAARRARFPLNLRSAYRLAVKLKRHALSWRAWLCVMGPAPALRSAHPLQQLQAHLTATLGLAPFERLEFRQSGLLV